MTVTRHEVMTNYECENITGVSTQEEADTLMIYRAVDVARNGMNVHIFTKHRCSTFGCTKKPITWRAFCTNHGHKRKTMQGLPTAYI